MFAALAAFGGGRARGHHRGARVVRLSRARRDAAGYARCRRVRDRLRGADHGVRAPRHRSVPGRDAWPRRPGARASTAPRRGPGRRRARAAAPARPLPASVVHPAPPLAHGLVGVRPRRLDPRPDRRARQRPGAAAAPPVSRRLRPHLDAPALLPLRRRAAVPRVRRPRGRVPDRPADRGARAAIAARRAPPAGARDPCGASRQRVRGRRVRRRGARLAGGARDRPDAGRPSRSRRGCAALPGPGQRLRLPAHVALPGLLARARRARRAGTRAAARWCRREGCCTSPSSSLSRRAGASRRGCCSTRSSPATSRCRASTSTRRSAQSSSRTPSATSGSSSRTGSRHRSSPS